MKFACVLCFIAENVVILQWCTVVCVVTVIQIWIWRSKFRTLLVNSRIEAHLSYCVRSTFLITKASLWWNTSNLTSYSNFQIFRLEPKVQGVFSDKEPASSVMGELSAHEKAEKRIELHNLYGTKKSIRQVRPPLFFLSF